MIDYSRDANLTPEAITSLKDRYMLASEKSPQEAFMRAAKAYSDNADHAQRLYDYASKKWMMFSTPVLVNGGNKRGLPISCYLGYVPDSTEGILNSYTEACQLTRNGGGIGYHLGDLRSDNEGTSIGTKSTGVIGFVKPFETLMLAFAQGQNRRGAVAIYMDMAHPEIEEFITIRKPGGDQNRKCWEHKVFHHAVNIPDAFMEAVKEDGNWSLIDPHSKTVKKVVKARDLWIKLLETRMETGEPYFMFVDEANRQLPQALKDKGLKIRQSNLCCEIFLPTNEERTAVCCLSSVNLETYDEWKDDPLFIEDMIRMLDNVLTSFISRAQNKQAFQRAVTSALAERSLGLGAMGFHSYLQSKGVPFESAMARGINKNMFKLIKERAVAASQKLAKERGEAPDMVGTGLRNAHLMAIAPNASSGDIVGTSPSIEPLSTNYFVKKTDSGSFVVKNKHLQQLLGALHLDTEEVWKSIRDNGGSVQHLEFLEQDQRDTFKTAFELDQRWIVQHAADRQPHICQGQSVNLFFPNDATKKELHDVHLMAYEQKLKGLYYCRSTAQGRVTSVGQKIDRQVITQNDEPACLGCEG